MSVRRIYVEKKRPYAVQAKELKEEIGSYLGITGAEDVRVGIFPLLVAEVLVSFV